MKKSDEKAEKSDIVDEADSAEAKKTEEVPAENEDTKKEEEE